MFLVGLPSWEASNQAGAFCTASVCILLGWGALSGLLIIYHLQLHSNYPQTWTYNEASTSRMISIPVHVDVSLSQALCKASA